MTSRHVLSYELGLASSANRTNVPASTSWRVSRCHPTDVLSHQTTWSGRGSSATSRTHSRSRRWRVGAWSRPGTVVAVIAYLVTDAGTSGCGANRTGCACGVG